MGEVEFTETRPSTHRIRYLFRIFSATHNFTTQDKKKWRTKNTVFTSTN